MQCSENISRELSSHKDMSVKRCNLGRTRIEANIKEFNDRKVNCCLALEMNIKYSLIPLDQIFRPSLFEEIVQIFKDKCL